MKREKSCGIVVFYKESSNLLVLLVHHNSGHWGFPKGHMENGETEEETGVREVLEETGIATRIISNFREVITYSPSPNIEKDVVFFIGEPVNKNTIPQITEVSEARFVDVEKAEKLITHENEKKVLKCACEKMLRNEKIID